MSKSLKVSLNPKLEISKNFEVLYQRAKSMLGRRTTSYVMSSNPCDSGTVVSIVSLHAHTVALKPVLGK